MARSIATFFASDYTFTSRHIAHAWLKAASIDLYGIDMTHIKDLYSR